MKILNLYAGIGGNRKLWGDGHKIFAVEIDPKIAEIYQKNFPNDRVIVGDAHQFLLDHFQEFEFIWSSPPCPSHSGIRKELGVEARRQSKPIYPDMRLYEEILLLQGYFKGKWVVENVISWYPPLIRPFKYASHYYWSNFPIVSTRKHTNRDCRADIKKMEIRKGFDLREHKGIDKRRILRNCVEPESGLEIFNMAFKEKQEVLVK